MWMSLEEYAQCLHGFTITDCAVRDRMRFSFAATRHLTDAAAEQEAKSMESPALRDKRVLPFFRDEPEGQRWSFASLENWDLLAIAGAQHPLNQTVVVDLEGLVFVAGSGVSGMEDPIPSFRQSGPRRGGMRKLRTIGGHVYACGGGRSVGKRLGPNQWLSHTQALPDPSEVGRTGFQDIDGFGERDLYAVGGKADVWRFDGSEWSPVSLPTNTWAESVCCAGDGQVYIACHEGLIVAGRGDVWRVIGGGGILTGLRDIVWYEDRVWCTNDYGIWQIHEGKLAPAEVPPFVTACAGHLDAQDGVLLVAGLGGAAFKEEGAWQSIVLWPEMEQAIFAASK